MKRLFRISLLLCMLCCAPFAQPQEDDSQPVGSIPITSETLSSAQVSEAVVAALNKRKWTVIERSEAKVVGHLTHSGVDTEITFLISKDSIEMSCWGYEIHKKTKERLRRVIHRGWIKNLKVDITHLLYQQQIINS